ncbi:hypothetical protein DXG01_010759 [Tephrocybe rancida]|nr:hypothetical protein DXG01_010759 [Tephrocybe rancida]
MAELVKERKIKYLGLSERTAKTLRRAHTVHPISTIQMGFSPFVLDVSDPQLELLKTSRELGVRIVCYSPLGRGLYTGKCVCWTSSTVPTENSMVPTSEIYRGVRNGYSGRDWPRILNVVSQLGKIGAAHNATSAQITLTWLLTQGDDFLVTPGMRKIHYLGGNLGAAPVHLTKEEVDSITKIANETEMPGARYGAWHSAQVYV